MKSTAINNKISNTLDLTAAVLMSCMWSSVNHIKLYVDNFAPVMLLKVFRHWYLYIYLCMLAENFLECKFYRRQGRVQY